ncbi:MAG: hypothetical protein CL608_07445 [Anaerolineaceae bacterium]|nr:hypothetical protein [Anaerolineaceae bacterium]
MNKKRLAVWLILTLFFSGVGLVFAFIDSYTLLAGFLVYLPLTAGIVWLAVYRRKVWFGLWFLVYLAWLTYLGPYVGVALARFAGVEF